MANPPKRPLLRKVGRPSGVPPEVKARARAALLGLCVGDAVAVPFAGRRLQAAPFPSLQDSPVRDLVGGGPAQLKAGQVSGLTQMATALAWSLAQAQRYDPEDVYQRYIDWLPQAVAVDEPLKEAVEALKPARLGQGPTPRERWVRLGEVMLDGTPLTRAVPIAIYFAQKPDDRARAAMMDCALTNFPPLCQLSCATLAAAVAAGVNGAPKPPDIFELALSELAVAAAFLGRTARDDPRAITEAVELIKEDLTWAQSADPMVYGPDVHLHYTPRHVRVAFRLAFWHLWHTPKVEQAVLDVVHRGGAADVNAAITGALLCALHGPDALPRYWTEPLLDALSPPYEKPGPLYELYHPKQLLRLLVGS